jgi:hypothetical protein
MARGRVRKFVTGVGWVKPKKGYCWTLRGDRIRSASLPAWGSRKFGPQSEAERSIDP